MLTRYAPLDRVGIASATFNTTRQFGTLLGIAISGAIVNAASSFMVGLHSYLYIAALANVLGFIAVMRWIPKAETYGN
jgi:MFS transporter, DHA2 family, methylenomycin A resistance protein